MLVDGNAIPVHSAHRKDTQSLGAQASDMNQNALYRALVWRRAVA
jgi:hypothetical protein